MIAYLSSATRCPVERFRAALYGDETRRRSENKGRNRKSGKRKGRNALDILHFARGPRVYPQREYGRNVYTLPAILYPVPRRKLPFIFRQRGVIALSRRAEDSGRNVKRQASLKE